MSSTNNQDTSMTLLARIQVGEPEAWRQMSKLYDGLVRFWCRRWGVTEADLDDMVQEIWAAVGPTLATFQARSGRSFRGWLRGITHNKVRHWYRRRSQQLAQAAGGSLAIKALEQVEDSSDNADLTDPAEQTEIKLLYRRALELVRAEFEVKTWTAFWEASVEGKATSDVAAELGMSSSGVRMAKSRVLSRLRQELGELLD
jgi:RNA polymerase sigma-70 factor (ECF subfamily)